MGIKMPNGKEYSSAEEMIEDGWVQRKGGRWAKLLVEWQIWIWFVGLIIIIAYTFVEIESNKERLVNALYSFKNGDYLEKGILAKRYGVDEVGIDRYLQLAVAYNRLLKRCCILEGNPKEVCDRINTSIPGLEESHIRDGLGIYTPSVQIYNGSGDQNGSV